MKDRYYHLTQSPHIWSDSKEGILEDIGYEVERFVESELGSVVVYQEDTTDEHGCTTSEKVLRRYDVVVSVKLVKKD